MNRIDGCMLAGFLVLSLASTTAWAQVETAQISGIIKDSSGAVLPGVTVEASSPALIEKVRSAVSDGQGHYSIIELRPGAYTVTFTLPGFSTVKREGIQVLANASVPINAGTQSEIA